jgi:hypothetical protein
MLYLYINQSPDAKGIDHFMERMTIQSLHQEAVEKSHQDAVDSSTDKFSKGRVMWYALIIYIVQLMFAHLQIILYNQEVKAWEYVQSKEQLNRTKIKAEK